MSSTLLAMPGNQRYASHLLSGKAVPTSGIPLKDVGLFGRYAESAHASAATGKQIHAIRRAIAPERGDIDAGRRREGGRSPSYAAWQCSLLHACATSCTRADHGPNDFRRIGSVRSLQTPACMTSHRRSALTAIAFVLSLAPRAHAAPEDTPSTDSRVEAAPDDLFARSGGFSATVASGLPFLGIGELTYGVSDRFSIGAVGAATPDVAGVRGTLALGLRPRGVVFHSGAWRSALVVPVFYYPQVEGFGDREPWMLTRPTVTLERELQGGARVDVGVGLIAAACMDSLLTLGKERTMMGGVWNTATVGGSVPVSRRTSVLAEASLVLRGVAPARDWIGGAPVIAFAGVVTSF